MYIRLSLVSPLMQHNESLVNHIEYLHCTYMYIRLSLVSLIQAFNESLVSHRVFTYMYMYNRLSLVSPLMQYNESLVNHIEYLPTVHVYQTVPSLAYPGSHATQ